MTELPHNPDVVILGAGAAGLMCALTAAQQGRRVLVLEKANKVGKKILMSGGGRCNFTNYFVEADNYISNNPHFCKAALKRYSPWDFIGLVERYEIPFEERQHSQLFCLHSAKDILSMLLQECAQVGVEIQAQCELQKVKALAADGASRYAVQVMSNGVRRTIECHSLVVATGALSIPTLGGSGVGYELAAQFGLSVTARRAGLVPLMFSDQTRALCERLSGLALPVSVSCQGQTFRENLLFTHRGVSGPVILQISNYWTPGASISIDLLPAEDAAAWLMALKHEQPLTHLKTVLTYKLAKSLVAELEVLFWPSLAGSKLAEITDQQLRQVGEQLNHWLLKPSATEGYRTAEVTLGGVDTNGVSSKTMEAKQQPGLYFIGEVLDVSGHLGGFNFQWAWSSGYSAGLVV
ncbi:MAG: NAD(P)/FAD-dependent oxidoreductase [SAR86 cluster bacterium]